MWAGFKPAHMGSPANTPNLLSNLPQRARRDCYFLLSYLIL
jgi:hypothetical protein